jgi:hypothetical protein
VNTAHQVGCAQVQLVVALVDEHALRIEHRADGAVEKDERLGIEQALQQLFTSGHGRIAKYIASG